MSHAVEAFSLELFSKILTQTTQAIKWCKNIAENFNRLCRAHWAQERHRLGLQTFLHLHLGLHLHLRDERLVPQGELNVQQGQRIFTYVTLFSWRIRNSDRRYVKIERYGH